MPLAKKNPKEVLPESFKAQIQGNVKKDEPVVPYHEEVPEAGEKSQPKGRYADSVNLRLSSGKRNEFKAFFAKCEISMNQGFEAAVEYLIMEANAGRVKVSKCGVTKVDG
jgi:hypothetical protein